MFPDRPSPSDSPNPGITGRAVHGAAAQQPLPALPSRLDAKHPRFASHREANLAALEELEQALAASRAGGGERYVQRHLERGKLLPRARVEHLLDEGSYFLELSPLAGHGMRGIQVGGSVITGVGLVSGVECLVTASEATVKGGAVNEAGLARSLRAAEIAEQNRLPSIALVESAGADLPNQSKIFTPGGASFRSLTQRSRAGIPTVCVVFGSSTAGGAYLPGLSDYVIMVRDRAQVYLGGPPLVKMATGEETDHESLGGARMHSEQSGVSDYLADDELHAIRLAREVVSHLDWRRAGGPPLYDEVEPPRYDPEELLGLVPADLKEPFDTREVLARVVDGSRFSEFKPRYGSTLVCGWARLSGYPVGILANNGTLFSESAHKGAQFIQLCNASHTPLLFFQNITGFMVGTKYEREGIIKHGAKLINAVSNSTVPAITVMMGASFGAGNYGMAGRAYGPRFVFSWPSHRIAVMGGEQLAGVLEIIQRESAARKGEAVDESRLGVAKAMLKQQIDKESSPYFATARVWDDGIIDPRDTRVVLSIALSAAHNAPVQGTHAWGVFRH